jgi:hypothetical protein
MRKYMYIVVASIRSVPRVSLLISGLLNKLPSGDGGENLCLVQKDKVNVSGIHFKF